MKRLRKLSIHAASFMLGLTGLLMWMMSMQGGAGLAVATRPDPEFGINPVIASALPILTVTNTNDNGPGSLRQAITDAVPGDTINFSVTGTITLTSGQLDINNNLTILGPGAASLTISGNNASRVFQIGSGVTVTVSDLTISNGNTTGNGGGILNSGTLTITNSTLSDNSSPGGILGGGGGIFNSSSGTLTITNTTLSDNSVTGGSFGGGIFNNTGTLTITDSTLSDNSAFRGGGIFNNSGKLTVTDSILSDNAAVFGGGVFTFGGGPVTIASSTLSGNSASGGGGGISNGFNTGTVMIINSTISNNSTTGSGRGGGIFNSGSGTLTITNTTLSGNSASGGFSAGIENSLGEITIRNSIVANIPSGDGCAGSGTFNVSGVNFSTDGSCPGFTQVLPAQLNLGPLAVSPPGTTATHALLPGSIAIDAATDCTDAFALPVATDQRGVARPQDGEGNGVAVCDVGAYEAADCISDSTPPQITCPGSITVTTAGTCSQPTGAVVNYTATASDNCTPNVMTFCSPASQSVFPVGTTTVTCTATDVGGNTAVCSFTVTVFDGCLQDDSDPNIVVLYNTLTGAYRFCCNGVTSTGVGTVTKLGCVVTIEHNTPDRRVRIKIDSAVKKGMAAIQRPPGSGTCTITDKDITNNTNCQSCQ